MICAERLQSLCNAALQICKLRRELAAMLIGPRLRRVQAQSWPARLSPRLPCRQDWRFGARGYSSSSNLELTSSTSASSAKSA